MSDLVRSQYERFPYPPIPTLALPGRSAGEPLRYERGTRICHSAERDHAGIRILVVGAGTFESLVVAQRHPRAASVTALDLSGSSLRILRRRLSFSRLSPFRGRLPRLETIEADLTRWEPATAGYDYILASNVLHHLPDPSAALERIARWLSPEGVLRVVTYPRQSRIWMRETSRWLRLRGVTAENPAEAPRAIRELPPAHPARVTFESHPETGRPAGLVDAFLHPLENPLMPLQWMEAASRAHLVLAGEDQDPASQSGFLEEILPATTALSRWEKLQILDDALELCANPVFWFKPGDPDKCAALAPATEAEPAVPPKLDGEFLLSSRIRYELGQGLARAGGILASCGSSGQELLEALREKVGPRYAAGGRLLPNLSLTEHEATAEAPFTRWDELENGTRFRLSVRGEHAPVGPLSRQAEWAQIRFGALESRIPVLVRSV